jgi:GT2 family glycosyltransferase
MTLYGLTCQFLGLSSLLRGSAIFNPEHYGGWKRDTERNVDIVTGCFLLIRRNLWNELGGFDLKFVMYGEESDLCLRARKLGARPRVTPDAQIIHYGGASQRIRADRIVRLLRGKISLVDRHFGAWTRPLALMLLRLWPASRAWTSRLTRSPGESAWEEIWQRRAEWWHGWFGIKS